jgi:hypothetical protein
MSKLLGSVGDGGRNIPSDVKAVQYLLSVRGMNPGAIDSVCGKKTIGAIERFQGGFMGHPDGLVESEGMTWKRLAGHTNPTKPAAAPATARPAAARPAAARPTATAAPKPVAATPIVSGNSSLVLQIPKPARGTINQGLTAVNNAYMLQKFGHPRTAKDYDFEGKSPTNPKLARAMVTADVGPFRVTGLGPAVTTLTAIMADIKKEHFEAYSQLKSWGMLNVRWVKTDGNKAREPSKRSISNHSFGTAIDISFKGHIVDTQGNNKVYFGLALIAPIFNRHNWYWGAGFNTEDGMHFEASKGLVDSWANTIG